VGQADPTTQPSDSQSLLFTNPIFSACLRDGGRRAVSLKRGNSLMVRRLFGFTHSFDERHFPKERGILLFYFNACSSKRRIMWYTITEYCLIGSNTSTHTTILSF
jgi:hypothetical protein